MRRLREMDTRKWSVCFLVSLWAVLLSTAAQSQDVGRVVVYHGEPIPEIEGATFESVYTDAEIGTQGDVVFTVRYVDPATGETVTGVWVDRAGERTCVARSGEVDAATGRTLQRPGAARIHASGAVDFFATVEDGAGSHLSVWRWNRSDGSRRLLLEEGDEVEGATVTGPDSSDTLISGDDLVLGALVEGPMFEGERSSAILRVGVDGARVIAASGLPMPGAPDGTEFFLPSTQSGRAVVSGGAVFFFSEGQNPDLALDNTCALERIPGGLFSESSLVRPWSRYCEACPTTCPPDLDAFACEAFLAFAPPGSYSVGPLLGNSGGMVAHAGGCQEEGGVWLGTGGDLEFVPRGEGLVDDQPSASAVLTDSGEVVFAVGSGIWSYPSGEALWRAGEAAPGTEAGVEFAGFGLLRANRQGDLAFRATLSGTSGVTNTGIWVRTGGGPLALLAREGQMIELAEGVERRLNTLAMAGDNLSAGNDGRRRAFSGSDLLWIANAPVFGVQSEQLALVVGSPKPSRPAGYVVNSTGIADDTDPEDGVCDTGQLVFDESGNQVPECTLRAAIMEANADPDLTRITFNIRDTGGNEFRDGVAIIVAAQDPVRHPTELDATTQPQYEIGRPRVALTGRLLKYEDGLLRIEGGGSTVKGFVLHESDGPKLVLTGGGGNVVQASFIGSDTSGSAPGGKSESGILILNSPDNVIGGRDAATRNVISGAITTGTTGCGIRICGAGSSGNQVVGNFIGTDVSGTHPIGNPTGVCIEGASGNVIGGSFPGEGNVISGNTLGVSIESTSGDNNICGVSVASGNRIVGNLIGTDASGANPLGNLRRGGIQISESSSNAIGGTGPGDGNVIAFNGGDGISISAFDTPATGNAIRGNLIFSNDGLGIDLNQDDVSGNDPDDTDDGANLTQNFPDLLAAASSDTKTVILGSLFSTPDTAFDVEFFSNTECDSPGAGEGESLVGPVQVRTDDTGEAEILATFTPPVPLGASITATATDPDGNTSEFSFCVEVEEPKCTIHPDAAVAPAGGTHSVVVALRPPLGGIDVTVDVTRGGAPVTSGACTTAAVGGACSFSYTDVLGDGTDEIDAHATLEILDVSVICKAEMRWVEQPEPESRVVLSEVDAINSGDEREQIELVTPSPASVPLDGLTLVIYDGATNATHAAFDLDGLTTDETGVFVAGNASLGDEIVDLPIPSGSLPDALGAVALFNASASSFPPGTPVTVVGLVDVIVYSDGEVAGAELSQLLGAERVWNEGANGDPFVTSVQLCEDGLIRVATPSPGERNSCAEPSDLRFVRGDCNDDGRGNISDALCLLNWLFGDGPVPGCQAAANVNGDAATNISDVSYLLNHLFSDGPPPPAPFPECGPGELPADETIGCETPPTNCR